MVNLTPGEKALSRRIIQAQGQGPGTVWGPTSQKLAEILGVPVGDVGAISIRTGGVIGNRLCTPGVIRSSPSIFLVASLEEDYGNDVLIERIKELVPLTRHLRTVLIARPGTDPEDGSSIFRVTDAVVVAGLTRIDLCLPHFPALTNVVRLPLTPLGSGTAPLGRRAWFTRAHLRAGARTWYETITAGASPAVGERVLFVEDSATAGQLRLVAHGVVTQARMTGADSVTVQVSELRWPADDVFVEEDQLTAGAPTEEGSAR